MKTRVPLFVLAIALTVGTGCSKDKASIENSCEKLSSGLAASDQAMAGQAINQIINLLPSAEYTGPNLDALAEKMSVSCAISTSVSCLNCNHTEPLQTELTVHHVNNEGVILQKTVIITHTASNKMIFHSMRE